MKAPVSTALSMAAILATGGAALAVNASVLDPQSESAPASTDSATASSTPDPSPSPAVNEFQIPGIGLVTLSTISGTLTLGSVTVGEGISYTVTETTPGDFTIEFNSADQVVTFSARLADGQIVTSATATSKRVPPAQSAATQPAMSQQPSGSGGTRSPIDVSDHDDDGGDDDHDDGGEDHDDD